MGERYGCSCILEIGDDRIMVDCGPGTTYKMARMGMSPTQVNSVFLTHHHSDHIVDFPCFALLRFDLDPGDLPPLRIFGPPRLSNSSIAFLARTAPSFPTSLRVENTTSATTGTWVEAERFPVRA